MAPVRTPNTTEKRRHESASTPESSQKRTKMSAAEQKHQQDDDLFRRIKDHFDASTDKFKEAFDVRFAEIGDRIADNTANIAEIRNTIKDH